MEFSREQKTIAAMIGIYCEAHHGTKRKRCEECEALFDYAMHRLDKCPFVENKPACSECKVHCYQPEMRVRIMQVMRYAGPRMMKRHPVLALFHLAQKKK
jgi:hypothetical protein